MSKNTSTDLLKNFQSIQIHGILKSHILKYMILNEFQPKETPACPHCESKEQVVKHGNSQTGHQRYLCKKCNKTFSAQTGSVLGASKISIQQWLLFARCNVSKITMKRTASICNVSCKTASSMKKRIKALFDEYYGNPLKVERLKLHMALLRKRERERAQQALMTHALAYSHEKTLSGFASSTKEY